MPEFASPPIELLRRKRARLIAECDATFLEALTSGNNGPIPEPERTLGWAWVKFAQVNCRMGEGDLQGQPPTIHAWQQLLLWKLAELNDDGSRRYDFAVVSLGKGSGKSPMGGWVGSICLAGPEQCAGFNAEGVPIPKRRNSPDVLNMASSYPQADLILDEMRVTFSEGPLAKGATAEQGKVALTTRRGRARRIPATTKQADGTKATTLLVDEVHELTGEGHTNAYDVASAGTAKRVDGLVLMLSTAGFDLETLFGRVVSRGLRGEFKQHELFVYLRADDKLDPKRWPDMIREGRQADVDAEIAEGIRQANPLVACGAVPVNRLVSKFKDMPLFRALRYYWNRWTASDESWLPVGAWDGCRSKEAAMVLAPDARTFVGVDMAMRRDSAAIIVGQFTPAGRFRTVSKIWYPNGELIDQSECDDYLRWLNSTFDVEWIAGDEAWWPTLPSLEGEGLPIFRMPQQGRNMIVAYSRLYRLIVDGVIEHDGSPDYADQIASAVPDSTDRGWTLRKGKQRGKKIDSAPALAGCVFASEAPAREREPVIPRSEVF